MFNSVGLDNKMRLFNIWGDLVKSIYSKYSPWDIACMLQSGDSIDTDDKDRTLNTVKGTRIRGI